MDFEDIEIVCDRFQFCGVQGIIGFQVIFLEFFEGNVDKIV